MAKNKKIEAIPISQEMQRALDRFPEIVAEKKRRYVERQAFLKRTFGDLVKALNRERRKK